MQYSTALAKGAQPISYSAQVPDCQTSSRILRIKRLSISRWIASPSSLSCDHESHALVRSFSLSSAMYIHTSTYIYIHSSFFDSRTHELVLSLSVCGTAAERFIVMGSIRTCVIGGGIVGLAIARALLRSSRCDRQLLLLERNAMCGSETSSRSSEVVHAALYYEPSSHKAQLCLRGRTMLYDYCQGTHTRTSTFGGSSQR